MAAFFLENVFYAFIKSKSNNVENLIRVDTLSEFSKLATCKFVYNTTLLVYWYYSVIVDCNRDSLWVNVQKAKGFLPKICSLSKGHKSTALN